MKYKVIYDVIYASGGTTMRDFSSWHKINKSYVEQNRPLWLILENRRVNLRLWVTHGFGKLEIATAQLDLGCKTPEYSASFRHYDCKNQNDMAKLLSRILNGKKQVVIGAMLKEDAV